MVKNRKFIYSVHFEINNLNMKLKVILIEQKMYETINKR